MKTEELSKILLEHYGFDVSHHDAECGISDISVILCKVINVPVYKCGVLTNITYEIHYTDDEIANLSKLVNAFKESDHRKEYDSLITPGFDEAFWGSYEEWFNLMYNGNLARIETIIRYNAAKYQFIISGV